MGYPEMAMRLQKTPNVVQRKHPVELEHRITHFVDDKMSGCPAVERSPHLSTSAEDPG